MSSDIFTLTHSPTARKPLLGLTILLVEDSRFACEGLRLLSLQSGARLRRADSLQAARRHLQVYRPCVAIIDLGLPDGCGTALVAELATATPRPYAVLACSGDSAGQAAALSAGADEFLLKPLPGLAAFQSLVLSYLPAERRPPEPRVLPGPGAPPDPLALRDDLMHAASALEGADAGETLDYAAQFLRSLGRSAGDSGLEAGGAELAAARAAGRAGRRAEARLAELVQDRLARGTEGLDGPARG